MNITDSEVIKTGERELIDAITADLDWSAIEEIFHKEHNLKIEEDIDFQSGDIIPHNDQIAYQLKFEIKVSLSVLLDRDGNYISVSLSGPGDDSGANESIHNEEIDAMQQPNERVESKEENSIENPDKKELTSDEKSMESLKEIDSEHKAKSGADSEDEVSQALQESFEDLQEGADKQDDTHTMNSEKNEVLADESPNTDVDDKNSGETLENDEHISKELEQDGEASHSMSADMILHNKRDKIKSEDTYKDALAELDAIDILDDRETN